MLISPLTGDENNCICPFHKGCLEGLASGPAIMHRTGVAGNELLLNDSVWELEAEYLSIALSNMILAISPQKVILGGGVMHQKQLFTMIRRKVEEKLGGYLSTDELKNMENYIVPAELGDDQGIVGCMHLAMQLI